MKQTHRSTQNTQDRKECLFQQDNTKHAQTFRVIPFTSSKPLAPLQIIRGMKLTRMKFSLLIFQLVKTLVKKNTVT